MAGSPGGIGRPGRVTMPTPFAGAEDDAAARHAPAHGREDQGAVGHVGIVAGVLDHAGGRAVRTHAGDRQREDWDARRGAASPRPDRGTRRSAAPHRPPWRPQWRRCRWSSRGGAEGLARSSRQCRASNARCRPLDGCRPALSGRSKDYRVHTTIRAWPQPSPLPACGERSARVLRAG